MKPKFEVRHVSPDRGRNLETGYIWQQCESAFVRGEVGCTRLPSEIPGTSVSGSHSDRADEDGRLPSAEHDGPLSEEL